MHPEIMGTEIKRVTAEVLRMLNQEVLRNRCSQTLRAEREK